MNIGRLTTQKNQKLLIEFFRNQLKKTKKTYYYILLGEGEKKKELEKLIFKYQLKKIYFYWVIKKNIYSYFIKIKSNNYCTLWEDPGAVMIEAAFCNIPIISSDCKNGTTEFLMNSRGGLSCLTNNNIDSLKNTIYKI